MGMSEGVFSVMKKMDLTTLEMFFSRKDNTLFMRGMKEWDDDLQFSRYTMDFSYLDMLTAHYKALGASELIMAFEDQGLKEYLKKIEELIRLGRHEGIDFFFHKRKDIRMAFCKHSVILGIRNRKHAIRAGAMRRHELNEQELDVLIDGLNLSRAMTYKNAVAAIPYGGCKTVVQCAPVKLDDLETIGFISYVADRTRNFPGADMGMDEAMVDVIHEKFTQNYIGGTKSPLVSTGTPTAYGEYVATKEACDFLYGSPNLAGRTIAIQGLGHVGYPLAEYFLKDGAKLVVSDIDLSRVKKLQDQYSADLVRLEPDEIYMVEAEIFAPCAIGGIITEERIPEFKFKIILGSANNQLKATSKEAEISLAKKVADAGILFVEGWAHNTGGVIAAALLWQLQEEATVEQLWPMIELPCSTNFRALLEQSAKTGKTPTEQVYENIDAMIYSSTRPGTGLHV
jgi:glutamate dehydrogenase/leucine dehydrogenase